MNKIFKFKSNNSNNFIEVAFKVSNVSYNACSVNNDDFDVVIELEASKEKAE